MIPTIKHFFLTGPAGILIVQRLLENIVYLRQKMDGKMLSMS